MPFISKIEHVRCMVPDSSAGGAMTPACRPRLPTTNGCAEDEDVVSCHFELSSFQLEPFSIVDLNPDHGLEFVE